MDEVKRKRLSLKSKKSSTQSDECKDRDTNSANKRKDQPPSDQGNRRSEVYKMEKIQEKEESEKADIICLSDEEETGSDNNHMRTRSEGGNKSLLDIPDGQLRELRRKLLDLRQQQSLARYAELPSLPLLEKENTICGQREATSVAFASHSNQEYSPFPQMCQACARKRPLYHDFTSVIQTVLSNFPTKTTFKMSCRNDLKGHTSHINSSKEIKLLSYWDKNIQISAPSYKLEGDSTDSDDILMASSREIIQRTDEPAVGSDETKTRENSTSSSVPSVQAVSVMSSCPLCTVQFVKGTSQMDIDGHIAACLSAAGDDVMW